MSIDEPIRVVAHDPAWAARFEQESTALEDAIGRWASGGIHHVGSTSVPGLEAKPIIDLHRSEGRVHPRRAGRGARRE